MKRLRFIIPFLVLSLIFGLGLAACSSTAEPELVEEAEVDEPEEVVEEETTELPDYITLSLEGERDGDNIIFYGETNLPDGVLLSYEVSIPETLQEEEYIWEDGIMEVKDGKFSGKASNFPEGVVEVWVAFQTILGTELSQPQEVIEKYGEMGENIDGENIYEVGEMKRIEKIINIK